MDSSLRLFAPVLFVATALLSLLTVRADETVFYILNLHDPAIRRQLETQGAEITDDGPGGSPAVRFTRAPGQSVPTGLMANLPLDILSLRGAKVALTASIRADNIVNLDPAKPLASYLGGKCQLFLETATGKKHWHDTTGLHGTFAWRESGLLAGVPDDVTSGSIRIGLENATGTFWLANLQLRVLQTKAPRPTPTPAITATVSVARTTMRGVMSPHDYREQDFADLAAWNVNAVRWQLYQQANDTTPYDAWLAAKLDDLARALDGAARHGIKLAVDLHSPPGGRLPNRTMRMFMEKKHADHFIEIWETIAHRFKGHPALWAYNLVNEPVQTIPSPPGLDDWLGIQVHAARAIREIDPSTPIMIETDQWASPESFAWLRPVNIPGIIYQAHMYWPAEYTHQGVTTNQGVADQKDFNDKKVPYPGTLHTGAVFDKAALRAYLQPVRDFQLATGAPIFIGEFSAIRWAPGADRYLDDLISIFEEYGWDWTYHAFREWPGWSVEHADLPYDRNNHPPATEPTQRLLILKKAWSKNNTPQPRETP